MTLAAVVDRRVATAARPGSGTLEQVIEFYCTTCAEPAPFEQPPCPDGHGDDCPEWLCLRCGDAILLDPPLPAPASYPLHTAA